MKNTAAFYGFLLVAGVVMTPGLCEALVLPVATSYNLVSVETNNSAGQQIINDFDTYHPTDPGYLTFKHQDDILYDNPGSGASSGYFITTNTDPSYGLTLGVSAVTSAKTQSGSGNSATVSSLIQSYFSFQVLGPSMNVAVDFKTYGGTSSLSLNYDASSSPAPSNQGTSGDLAQSFISVTNAKGNYVFTDISNIAYPFNIENVHSGGFAFSTKQFVLQTNSIYNVELSAIVINAINGQNGEGYLGLSALESVGLSVDPSTANSDGYEFVYSPGIASFGVAAVPEMRSWMMLILGVFGLAGLRCVQRAKGSVAM